MTDNEGALWARIYAAEYGRMCSRFNAAPKIERGSNGVPDPILGCAFGSDRCHDLALEAAERAVRSLRYQMEITV